MPLIPFADTDALTGQAKAAFEALPKKLNIFRVLAHSPACLVDTIRLGGSILNRQALDPGLREMTILLAAHLEGGTYEWIQHVPVAEALGVSREKIAALGESRIDAEVFAPKEKVLLAFVTDIVRNVRASDTSLSAMQLDFSSQEIVEVIVTCGFYMMLARLTETTQTEIDESGGMAVLRALGGIGKSDPA